jgi:hypothetical protein
VNRGDRNCQFRQIRAGYDLAQRKVLLIRRDLLVCTCSYGNWPGGDIFGYGWAD